VFSPSCPSIPKISITSSSLEVSTNLILSPPLTLEITVPIVVFVAVLILGKLLSKAVSSFMIYR
jgi:hypothetical protein